MTIRLTKTALTANGKRVGVRYDAGPWVEGVDPATIKIRLRRGNVFPAEVRAVLAVENNSDMREDYFEADTIRLLPGHPLYDQARGMV